MTTQFLKSQLSETFADDVAAHIQVIKDWMKLEGVARPSASAQIEAAIRRVPDPENGDDYVADYEVIDDTPSEEQQKLNLIGEMRMKEMAEVAKLIPVGKVRLLEMDYVAASVVPERSRTPEQSAAIEAFTAYKQSEHAIRYEVAQREAEIEDAATHEERIAIVEREFSK